LSTKPLFEKTSGFFNEAQTSKANNLKVTIGALKFASRINETPISKATRIEIGKLNYP
jgi:hypothetical protein